MRLLDDSGAEVHADMSLEMVDGRPSVTLESRSGALGTERMRNPAYNDGLELVLRRLADRSWSVLEITLESHAARLLSHAQRRLPLTWPLTLRPGIDVRQLRLLIADAQRAVAASPTKTPGTGNANKRIRLVVGGPATLQELSGGLAAAGSADVPLQPVAESASPDVAAFGGGMPGGQELGSRKLHRATGESNSAALGTHHPGPRTVLPWQQPGSRVLPKVLERLLSARPLSMDLASALGVDPAAPWDARTPEGSSVIDVALLSAGFNDLVGRLDLNLPFLTGPEAASIAELGAAELAFAFEELPLRTRTRNALLREYGGPVGVLPALARATVGEVVHVRHFGAVSFFDLATCLDQAFIGDEPQARGAAALSEVSQRSAETPPRNSVAPRSTVHEVGTVGNAKAASYDDSQGVAANSSAASIRAWQEPGSVVVPSVLLRSMSDRPLPDDFLSAFALDQVSMQKNEFPPNPPPFDGARLNNAFGVVMASCDRDTPLLTSLQVASLAGLMDGELAAAFYRLPLRRRTVNALLREFGSADAVLPGLARSAIKDLLPIPNFGAVSFLDLTSCLDHLFSSADLGQEIGGEAMYRDDTARPSGGEGELVFQQHPLADIPERADYVRGDDPRFADLLIGHDNLAEFVEWAKGHPARWRNGHAVLREVSSRLERLSGLTIEEEAEDVLRAALGTGEARWIDAMKRRYGLDGGDPGTLEEAAMVAGVTRERVRQIQVRVEGRLPRFPSWARATEQMMDLLAVATPCTAGDGSSALLAAGLSSREVWTAAQLVAAARLCGRELVLSQDGAWLGSASELAAVKEIGAEARKVSNFLGVAAAEDVGVRLSASTAQGLEMGLITAVLTRDPTVTFVDRTHFWTDHAVGRNRLVNVSQRILSAMQPQTLDDMLEGVARHYAWRSSTGGERFTGLRAPERDTLRAFYASHPKFDSLSDGRIALCEPPTDDSLGPETQALVGVLRAQAEMAMDRNSLIAACTEAGMSASTAGVLITYSECVKRFGPNVWGLRGAAPSDQEIARLQVGARQRAREVDGRRLSGRTPSGRPWFARRVTQSFLYSGVMSNDWEKNLLNGRTVDLIDGSDGEQVGQLRFADGFNYGYSGWLRRAGVSIGDILRVTVDPLENSCIVEHGGEELLSEPFDW